MQKSYLLLIIGAVVIVLLGLILLTAKGKPGPSSEEELKLQISPSAEKITPTPSDLMQKETGVSSSEISLTVISPKDLSIVSTSTITVQGKTKPQADVVINDKELKADSNGNFSTQIELDEGDNIIGIVASDEDGNYAEEEIIVTYEPVE